MWLGIFLHHQVLIAYLLDICQNDCRLKIPHLVSVARGSFSFSDSSCLSNSQLPTPRFLPPDCGPLASRPLGSQPVILNLLFLRKLVPSTTPLRRMGVGGSWVSPFDRLILCGCLLVSCVSASVACTWWQSRGFGGGGRSLSVPPGCFLSVPELATVPFQQFIKSIIIPQRVL